VNGGVRGEIVEPGDAAPADLVPGPARPRRPRLRALAGALAVGLLAVGVLSLREPAPEQDRATPSSSGSPTAAPSSVAPATLGWTGVAEVRLGMSSREYRQLYVDASGWDSGLRVSARDDMAGCVQYEATDRTQPTVWVWVRDDMVVTVGLDGVGATPTGFGVKLGQPFSRTAGVPDGWQYYDGDRIPIAGQTRGDIRALLADTDLDGLLDHANVSIPGVACDLRPAPMRVGGSLDRMAPAQNRSVGAGDIDGLTLDEVSEVGGIVSDVRPNSPDNWFGAARVVLRDGCAAEVYWQRTPGTLSYIDRPVWADFAMGPPVVTTVTVNLPC